ncbi:sensor histidine kinase [Williamsia sp. 1138]|nr:sensor histidine kinase [Williamsia sp. 1138]
MLFVLSPFQTGVATESNRTSKFTLSPDAGSLHVTDHRGMSSAGVPGQTSGWESLSARRAWMPGAVRETLEADPHPLTGKRTKRDVTIDVLMVALSLTIGIVAVWGRFGNWGPLLAADIVVGVLGCGALIWRRRWPLAIALILTLLSGVASFIGGAAFLALFSLAVHKPPRYSISIGALGICAAMSNFYLYPDAQTDVWYAVLLYSILVTAVAVGWGTMVRNRRQLLISLAELARNVESEQRERIAAARATERERLAREMHDVLAHRMSLLSVHAGALEFREDASDDEVRRAAGVIRAGVHQMLVDLRDVIGMLREETDDLASPMRTLAFVDELFAETELAGSPIRATIEIDDLEEVPGVISRAAYRIVQEGLTNARKHAGEVTITVIISGAPGQGLTICIRQPLNPVAAMQNSIPGTGSGLVGLEERVTLAGGEMEHGVKERNFVLTARLPWEAECPR